jgi:hypothetical protein
MLTRADVKISPCSRNHTGYPTFLLAVRAVKMQVDEQKYK